MLYTRIKHAACLLFFFTMVWTGCTTPVALDTPSPQKPPQRQAPADAQSPSTVRTPVQRREKARPLPSLQDKSASVSVDNKLPAIEYTIQVGAFSSVDRAAAYADLLESYGLDAYYFVDEDGLCKVRFERFDSEKDARYRAAGLQTMGWIDDYFVVRPPGEVNPVHPRLSLEKNIVHTARRFIGTSYRWGGQSRKRGFDCSGLTMTVYRLNGMELPRSSREQFRIGQPIERGTLRIGDLVFFATNGKGRVSHVGIYCGDGRFIHAPGQGKRIQISSLDNGYFSSRWMGGRRYF